MCVQTNCSVFHTARPTRLSPLSALDLPLVGYRRQADLGYAGVARAAHAGAPTRTRELAHCPRPWPGDRPGPTTPPLLCPPRTVRCPLRVFRWPRQHALPHRTGCSITKATQGPSRSPVASGSGGSPGYGCCAPFRLCAPKGWVSGSAVRLPAGHFSAALQAGEVGSALDAGMVSPAARVEAVDLDGGAAAPPCLVRPLRQQFTPSRVSDALDPRRVCQHALRVQPRSRRASRWPLLVNDLRHVPGGGATRSRRVSLGAGK